MIVHVMPTYACNQKCEYCYLRNNKEAERFSIMDIIRLRDRLSYIELVAGKRINRINVYGGEIALLNKDFLSEIFSVCDIFSYHISAITNLVGETSFSPVTDIISYYNNEVGFDIDWGTSLNDERPNNKETIANLLMLENKINVTQVVTPSLLKKDPEEILKNLSKVCRSVEFLIYSPSVSNSVYNLTNKDYEDFMIRILSVKNHHGVYIQNEEDIIDCIEGRYNSYMDSNIFIDPMCHYRYIKYKDGKEYFGNSGVTLDKYFEEVKNEKEIWNKKCKGCKYLGHCYAEHLKGWKDGDTCCGMYNLLEYYKQNIYKND